ncbi:MAG: restriction endonuclease subunit S [Cyclobacteriaceae bacterium]|nr:restriction endonuclease subunit S [Cyclobacteriaceae bacterium]
MEFSDKWIDCTLGDFLTLKNGYTFKSEDYTNEGLPIIRISDIQDGEVKTDDSVRIDKSKIKEGFEIKKGDVLVAMSGATTGKLGRYVSDEIAFQNQRVGNLIPKDPRIDKSFIYYWVSIHKKDIEDQAYGGAQPNISSKLIEEIPTRIPPLPEQKRIVAKLDNLFAHLDQLKARLQNIPTLLKQFRQAVLTQAVTGKLTEEWRKHNAKIETATLLLEKIKSNRTGQKSRKLAEIENTNNSILPHTWKWCQLDEISLLITDGKHGDCKNEINSGYYFLSAKDISNGCLNYDKAREIVYEEFYETHRRTNLEEGDICVVNTGATVGKSAIALNNEFTTRTTFQKSVAVIKLFKESIEPKYINYIIELETPRILQKSGGSAINNWLLSEMRAFWCQLPPTAEQKEIVRRVESLFAVADRIEANYKKLQEKIDHLPQAILSKAFRGELVPQDENDQPASVLLDKILRESAQNLKSKEKLKQLA